MLDIATNIPVLLMTALCSRVIYGFLSWDFKELSDPTQMLATVYLLVQIRFYVK